MSTIVSFKEFLRTGRLGPISTDLGPNALAQVMGAPEAVLIGERLPFPDYWCYGPLEFCFVRGPSGQPQMDFFQIENADALSGDCEVVPVGRGTNTFILTVDPATGESTHSRRGIGDALVIDLDGLEGRSRIPALLDAMRDCPGVEVVIRRHLGSESYQVDVMNGCIDIVMTFEIEGPSEAERAAWSDVEIARKAAALAVLDSIYAFKAIGPKLEMPDMESRVIPAWAFLTTVGA